MRTDSLPEYAQNLAWPLWSALALVLAFCSGFGLSEVYAAGPKTPDGRDRHIIIESGHSVRSVGVRLEEAGAIRNARVFRFLARILGYDTQLKAGEYQFESGMSLLSVLKKTTRGDVLLHPVTIPEGWTSAMIARHLAQSELLERPLPDYLPEGYYLPDTYFVSRGETRSALLERMARAQEQALQALWEKRQPDLPLGSPHQVRILASIVQLEAARPEELKRIAGVFINRLRKGMRLESDPTVIYGLTGGQPLARGLRQSELKQYTPYNTYRIEGLPPTPVCNPGPAAIAAVLNPATTEDLFFVADGKGGHRFAQTYDQHRRNVAHWRRIEVALNKSRIVQ